MKRVTGALLFALLAAIVVMTAIWPRAQMIASRAPADFAATPSNIARGEYLAKAGDCMACHTARGGPAYGGGRAIDTPFGRLFSPNITPDRETGIGQWSADDFWNALHNGIGKSGRLLYPAFPYTNYTRVTRQDADALFAYLRQLPAVKANKRAHQLDFPYDQQLMLAGWRLLYFRPAVFEADTGRDAAWNRGAYLVEGLGHCAACHSSRNLFGASREGLSGGLIPMLGWYAPSLTSDAEAGLGGWDDADIHALLKTGVSRRATVFGPMAEVVGASLQHLEDGDIRAMAAYLKSLPADTPAAAPVRLDASMMKAGEKLYTTHCVDCHGARGEGQPPHYPPLAGNRAITMPESVNAIRIVLNGGFPPGTAGNPRPYGMPPYSHALDDAEVAAVVGYIRASWGNQAAPVTAAQVNRYRKVPLD